MIFEMYIFRFNDSGKNIDEYILRTSTILRIQKLSEKCIARTPLWGYSMIFGFFAVNPVCR